MDIQLRFDDDSTVSISSEGDIYQNLADQLGISRYAAKVIMYRVLYGGSNYIIPKTLINKNGKRG